MEGMYLPTCKIILDDVEIIMRWKEVASWYMVVGLISLQKHSKHSLTNQLWLFSSYELNKYFGDFSNSLNFKPDKEKVMENVVKYFWDIKNTTMFIFLTNCFKITEIISFLTNESSQGQDNIYLNLKMKFSHGEQHLFNNCLNKGLFQDNLKHLTITPTKKIQNVVLK